MLLNIIPEDLIRPRVKTCNVVNYCSLLQKGGKLFEGTVACRACTHRANVVVASLRSLRKVSISNLYALICTLFNKNQDNCCRRLIDIPGHLISLDLA